MSANQIDPVAHMSDINALRNEFELALARMQARMYRFIIVALAIHYALTVATVAWMLKMQGPIAFGGVG